MKIVDLGLFQYEKAYQYQKNLVEKKKSDPGLPDTLLLVEHPEVYTYGRKSVAVEREGDKEEAKEKSFIIERGGEATFHNPGQLVCYPIMRLINKDVHQYLRKLEGVIIAVLKDFKINGERKEGATGVWVAEKKRKIASVGIAVSGWVTYHGTALNVSNDLRGFHEIQPCGFSAEVMTSIEKERSMAPKMSLVKESFVEHFSAVFDNRALRVDLVSSYNGELING